MQWIYFDASALVKHYSVETGTPLVNEVFRRLPPSQMSCSTIGVLEIVSILIRKRNDGRIDPRLFDQAMLEFKAEVIDQEAFLTTSVDDALLLSALELIAKHNLNATDAVVLRSALSLQRMLQASGHTLTLWTSDKRLTRAAQYEGLLFFDPEVEDMATLLLLLDVS